MSIFQPSTPPEISPETGNEIEGAEEQQELQDQSQDPGTDPEVGTDEAGTEEEQPSFEEEQGKLYAGKYNSPEEMGKAYKELQRAFTQTRQELAQMKQQRIQPQQQPPAQGHGQSREQINEMFWAQFQQDPMGAIFSVANAIADQRVQQVVSPLYESQQSQALQANLNSVAAEYPAIQTENGFKDFYGKVQEIANELGDPNIATNPSPRIMRMAAMEAFGPNTAKIYQQAKAKGAEEALNNQRGKQGLAGPTGTKPKQQPKTPEEAYADMIVGAGTRKGLFG